MERTDCQRKPGGGALRPTERQLMPSLRPSFDRARLGWPVGGRHRRRCSRLDSVASADSCGTRPTRVLTVDCNDGSFSELGVGAGGRDAKEARRVFSGRLTVRHTPHDGRCSTTAADEPGAAMTILRPAGAQIGRRAPPEPLAFSVASPSRSGSITSRTPRRSRPSSTMAMITAAVGRRGWHSAVVLDSGFQSSCLRARRRADEGRKSRTGPRR
jgi:hypothetical protein